MSEPLLTAQAVEDWNRYLDQWHAEVYRPLFAPRGVSVDAALGVWFLNRLRNVLPDADGGGDEPWR